MTQRELLNDRERCGTEVVRQLVTAVRRSVRLSEIVHQLPDAVIMEAYIEDAIMICSIIHQIDHPAQILTEIGEEQMMEGVLSADPVVRLEEWLKNRQ